MLDAIIEQLDNYCDCLPRGAYDDDKEVTELFEKSVMQIINIISLLTCWTQNPCETFLNGERSETIDVEPFNKCCCNGGIVEFKPHYRPLVADSIKVTLIVYDGIHEDEIPIDNSAFSWNKRAEVVKVDLRNYINFSDCGCPKKYQLVFEYDAGYELIPECLLPVFCNLLAVVIKMNECCCDCACNENDTLDEESDIAIPGVEIEYSEGVTERLDKWLMKLVLDGFQQQIALISICEVSVARDIWGVIV